MMRDIDDLLPEVLIHAPNCSDPIARRYLREAARDVCDKVDLWRERDHITISDAEGECLCTISDAEIVKIEAADLDGTSLTPQTPEWLDENYPGWDKPDESGATSRFITQIKPGTIQVVPPNTGKLSVRFILKPSRTATTLPDFPVEKYGTEIGKGAAARVLMLPTDDGGPNPQMGTRANRYRFYSSSGANGCRMTSRCAFRQSSHSKPIGPWICGAAATPFQSPISAPSPWFVSVKKRRGGKCTAPNIFNFRRRYHDN